MSNTQSSLEEFEKQLKVKNQEKTNGLAAFEEQLKAKNQEQAGKQQIVKVKKNQVINHFSDTTGCGHIRSLFPMNYINALFGKSGQIITHSTNDFVMQENLLIRSRSIYLQRWMSTQHLAMAKEYVNHRDRFKYKIIWDMDDMIWGLNEEQGGSNQHGVPSYNFGCPGITNEVKRDSVEIMNLVDMCTFSTPFLAEYAKNELGVKTECVVMQNSVAKFFWNPTETIVSDEPIKKPRVIYTGSPTHYSNERRMYGDWDNAWLEWVRRSVADDKITFYCMGGLPWFLEDLKDKIQVENWVSSYDYHNKVKNFNADIGIMPLTTNDFNRGKSNLKFLEYSAAGVLAIGPVFVDGTKSPYYDIPVTIPTDATYDQIDALVKKCCEPDFRRQKLAEQREYLDKNDHWLESTGYVNRFLKVITGANPGKT